MKKAKRLCVEEAVRAVLSDDDEEQNNSDYGSESDFETESEGEMHSNNDCDGIIDTDSAESDQLIPDPVPEQAPRRHELMIQLDLLMETSVQMSNLDLKICQIF